MFLIHDRKRHYRSYILFKTLVIFIGIISVIVLFFISVSVGAVCIPIPDIITTLINGGGSTLYERIIWNIRIPQALTAVVTGAGLAIAGVAMQSVLRNPLASPFTLGLSSSAAFGAAIGILLFDAGTSGYTMADAVVVNNPYLTTICAFSFSLISTGLILGISRLRSTTPETMILAGIAITSLCSAGLMAVQYFVDDTRLASIVFWQFGDVSRSNWQELGLITLITVVCSGYLISHRWDFNAIDAGEETAKGLGVPVERIRILGMISASLMSSVMVAFLGIIGFVGLVCPHMVRRIIGDDHRFLIPASCVCGSVLLLASDTVARMFISPRVLPVSIITAFLGAPLFLYLIMRRKR
nr:iron ABC transporter permease [uncultured Methanospirillum sp.]